MKKITENKWMAFFILQGTFLLIGTFFDLKISHTLFKPGTSFGWFFENFGEIPMTFFGATAALYIGLSCLQQKNKTIPTLFYLGMALAFSLLTGLRIASNLDNKSILLIIIVFVVTASLAYYLVRLLPKNDKNLMKYALFVLFVAFVNVISVSVIKQVWGRERYRHMASTNNYEGFSLWFIPQGLPASGEFKSFPSGHSVNASIIMVLALFPKFKEHATKIFLAVSSYVLLVQFSRIMQGAHFLSDVSASTLIGLLAIYFGYQWIMKEKLK